MSSTDSSGHLLSLPVVGSGTESRDLLVLAASAILAAGAFVLAGAFGPLQLLRYLYPAFTVSLAGLMLWLRPSWFLGFVWWIWLFTPLVRRLLDYQLGYLDINPVLVAPLAAAGLAALPILARPSLLFERRLLPFVFAITGLLIAYGIGLVRFGFYAPTFKLLEYVAPLLFGLYIVQNPEPLERKYRTLLIAVLSAGGISAIYGIMQFFWIPPWDQYWMMASNSYMPRDIAPGEFRIFGTVNSTHPFGYMMVAGLVMALGDRSRKAIVFATPMLAALLLSWTRAAWGAWVVALLVSFLLSRGEARAVIGRFMVAGAIGLAIILSAGPLGSRIAIRMDTIASLGDDGSLRHRSNLYFVRSIELLSNPIGAGLGSAGKAAKLAVDNKVNIDSGLITVPYELGWLGAFLYAIGLGTLVSRILKRPSRDDSRFVAAAGGVLGLLAASVFVNSFNGVHAMILWTFVGLCYGDLGEAVATRDRAVEGNDSIPT